MSLLQLEMPMCATREASDILCEVRRTGILPNVDETAAFSQEEHEELARAWQDGMRAVADRARRDEVARFAARGAAFRWFSQWEPESESESRMSNAIEEALEVVEQYFPKVAARGLNHAEDMGILQCKGRGASEGVFAKREAYGRLVLVSVYCVTGPTNFDPSTGSVEFERGARSHVFRLVYEELPSIERLAGDIAAYPLVTHPDNFNWSVKHARWTSEGWTGPDATRPMLHYPWDTRSADFWNRQNAVNATRGLGT